MTPLTPLQIDIDITEGLTAPPDQLAALAAEAGAASTGFASSSPLPFYQQNPFAPYMPSPSPILPSPEPRPAWPAPPDPVTASPQFAQPAQLAQPAQVFGPGLSHSSRPTPAR